MRGMTPGMSEEDVLRALGRPSTIHGRTWIYYFGPLSVGNECLQVDFDPHRRVQLLAGERLSRGWRTAVSTQDTEADVLKVLGPPKTRAGSGNLVECVFDKATVGFSKGRVVVVELR